MHSHNHAKGGFTLSQGRYLMLETTPLPPVQWYLRLLSYQTSNFSPLLFLLSLLYSTSTGYCVSHCCVKPGRTILLSYLSGLVDCYE